MTLTTSSGFSGYAIIHKAATTVAPNVTDWSAARARFAWEAVRASLGIQPGSNVNMAYLALDRHIGTPIENTVALRWIGSHGERRDLSFLELAEQAARFANVLEGLAVTEGQRVFVLLPRVPELYIAVLGALRNKNVVCTLFSAFGPEPILQRLTIGQGAVLVTTPGLYRKKIEDIRAQLPSLKHVLVVGRGEALAPLDVPNGTIDFGALLDASKPAGPVPTTTQTEPALLHFTSGTTGKPKGALHVHGALLHHHHSASYALDFHPGDVYWCTADPGWVTGTSYGILAPLTHGLTSIVYEGDFDAEAWYRVLHEEGVTVWYTAPTAVRMMMKAGTALARQHPAPKLRFIASVGEPLNPEGVVWGQEAFGLPIHDNWWQTETGGIIVANIAGMDIKPGSMGRPLPGIEAAVVRRTPTGVVVAAAGEQGEIAVRAGWPSQFREYINEPARTAQCFVDGWYLSGDLARVDEDGYFWFVGRSDDVIKTAGHLIGPFEVESVLMEHPAVVEAAVIGKPDPIAMETIKAFVSLKVGFTPSEALRRELLALTRTRLGSAVAPREIDFVASLPRTRSGKILRRLLRARELGLPEGDTSTLEGDAR
jgi:acetyl-CoA synthetase